MPRILTSVANALALSVALSTTASAQTAVHDYLADIDAMQDAHYAIYGWEAAEGTLADAFETHGVGWATRYVDTWSGWIANDRSHMGSVYQAAERHMGYWAAAVSRGDISEAEALARLAGPMQAMVLADELMHRGFEGRVEYTARCGVASDRAHAAEYGTETYNALRAVSDRLCGTSRAQIPWFLRQIEIIPHPDAGPENLYDTLVGSLPQAGAEPVPFVTTVRLLDLHAAAGGVPESDPFRTSLALLDRVAELHDMDVADLLFRMDGMDPAVQQYALEQAEWMLYEHVGELAPLWAAELISQGEVSAEDVSDFAAMGQRFAMLLDDLDDPTGAPSPALRALSGLHAAAEIIEMGEQEPEAQEALSVFNDLGTLTARRVPVTSVYAMQSGAVAGQLGVVRDGFNVASDALRGVTRAIQGDPSGLRQAQEASQRMRETLSPQNFGRSMAEGAVEGFISLVPGARSVLGGLFGSSTG